MSLWCPVDSSFMNPATVAATNQWQSAHGNEANEFSEWGREGVACEQVPRRGVCGVLSPYPLEASAQASQIVNGAADWATSWLTCRQTND